MAADEIAAVTGAVSLPEGAPLVISTDRMGAVWARKSVGMTIEAAPGSAPDDIL